MKLAALTTVAIAAGWTWASSAVALDGRGPSQPIAEGTVTFQRAEMARPVEAPEFPTAGVSGLFWVSPGDLTFHPVVPCRIVDTRLIAARLGNLGVYSFSAIALNHSSQGGFPGSCGVPSRALAVEVNITAVTPTAAGFMKVYPFGETQPNASIVNYSAGQNTANTATVARCAASDGSLCFRDLTVFAQSSAHLVVDVLGYYESPLTAQVDSSGSVYGASLGLYFVERFSPGAYGVHFYRDVSMCVFSATPGWGDALSTGAVDVEVNDLFESPDGVYVVMRNAAGTPTDFPFQLVVHC